jgi:5-methylcytosine-specific restriction endonuclease McrA
MRVQKEGKARDRYVCQICGSSECVEGHHILDVFFAGAAIVDNIITLCSKHHKDAHAGKLDISVF